MQVCTYSSGYHLLVLASGLGTFNGTHRYLAAPDTRVRSWAVYTSGIYLNEFNNRFSCLCVYIRAAIDVPFAKFLLLSAHTYIIKEFDAPVKSTRNKSTCVCSIYIMFNNIHFHKYYTLTHIECVSLRWARTAKRIAAYI